MNRNLRKQNNPGDQDLDWLAFCYVSDEMSDSERESFEIRLESDSLAQEALVDAVEQTQLIYASRLHVEEKRNVRLASQQSQTAPSWIKRPSVLFTAAAAMLLVVIGWSLSGNSTTPEEPEITDSGPVAATLETNLALAWADTLVEKEELVLDGVDEEFYDDFAEESPELDEIDETEDWMFVALTELEDSSEVLE